MSSDRRSFDYPFHLDVQTRWSDNDQYGHMNNSAYYYVSDSAINAYLVQSCGIMPFLEGDAANNVRADSAASLIGLIVSSSATYHAPASFPSKLRAGVRVLHLGNSSCQYEVGIFSLPSTASALPQDAQAAVLIRATHVFVARDSRRPVKLMPEELRQGLLKLKNERWAEQQQTAKL
ncbi:hypothetical protein CBOM_02300 [Ceraceosorus bombacis]|uniref:Uncharacterized protein n=1 Tax=Ceraceosorus bombacis TaxID=401625 RepID=A0A0P1BFI0_9BASI|nr:hypothetical protein CBOM_02300 [Ceraceosorus bombacis]